MVPFSTVINLSSRDQGRGKETDFISAVLNSSSHSAKNQDKEIVAS